MDDSIDKIKRHLGKGGIMRLHNEDDTFDDFHIDQLGTIDEVMLDKFRIKLIPHFKRNSEATLTEIFNNEEISSINELGFKSIKDSSEFSKLTEEEKKLFVQTNLFPILLSMLAVNTFGMEKAFPGDKRAQMQVDAMNKLRETHDKSTDEVTTTKEQDAG